LEQIPPCKEDGRPDNSCRYTSRKCWSIRILLS